MEYKRLEAYVEYLNFIQEKIDKFFIEQSPYICCKEGCSKCCESGEYPTSELEMHYLMRGFLQLPEDTRTIIRERIAVLSKQKTEFEGKEFLYNCPFLIDNKCSVYKYRPIICRAFGLSYYGINDPKVKLPFCINEGLNYSMVYDEERKTISTELYKKTGIGQEPLSYNLSLKFLLDNESVHNLGIEFGQERNLIEWFL